MKREGKIQVHSENIFPVIKKWLYSDKDIFLRELISNACDAIKKLQRLSSFNEVNVEIQNPRIEVVVDKEKKQLRVSDNGIGMTEEEVEKYITQIAFSGAEEFIKQYKDKGDSDIGIIGHFGLGFYSAFMVSDSVEIETLSYKENASPVHWSSDGSYTYEISEGTRKDVGTTIILNISDESQSFLDEFKIREILKKYCQFMPYEIFLNPKNDKEKTPVNNTEPLWKKAPRECTDEEYKKFYSETFMDINPPLFWIHLNVDYPFNLKGILYFPKQNDKLEVMPGQIKLFSNQVYIADNIKEVVPEFLMLLKGVIDCPDMPLNVSRSFLQNDGELAKISRHITKKVSDKLNSIFSNDRPQYESYWDDISPFIKFGCIKDEKFFEKVRDIILFKTINNDYQTLSEYIKTDDNKIYYVSDENVQSQYVRMFKDNNLNAVILDHRIDPSFISFIEYKEPDTKFVRVDSDISNALKDESKNESNSSIVEKFKSALNNPGLDIEVSHLKSLSTPAVIVVSEHERRLEEMSKIYGMSFGQSLNPKTKLILNLENEIIKSIENTSEGQINFVCKYVYDLALMSHRQLSPDELSEFIRECTELLNKIIK